METAIAHIQSLGFTLNEAKTYVALLACQPASAYEVAKRAAIPTSKIYETVNKLVTKGVLRQLEAAGKQTYVALSPDDFLARAEAQTQSQLHQLAPILASLNAGQSLELIWPIHDASEIQSKARQAVSKSRQTILISLWPNELSWLFEELELAEVRGVKIALVHFGKPAETIGATYHHPVENTLYNEKGGRGLTLVCDSEIVLIANYLDDGSIDASWSHNPTFITVAEDYVKHDVYITKATSFLNTEMKGRFGNSYERLRDVFDAEA